MDNEYVSLEECLHLNLRTAGRQNDGAEEKQPPKNPKPPEISRTKPNQKTTERNKKSQRAKKSSQNTGFLNRF